MQSGETAQNQPPGQEHFQRNGFPCTEQALRRESCQSHLLLAGTLFSIYLKNEIEVWWSIKGEKKIEETRYFPKAMKPKPHNPQTKSFAFPVHARYFPDRLFTEVWTPITVKNYRATSYLHPPGCPGLFSSDPWRAFFRALCGSSLHSLSESEPGMPSNRVLGWALHPFHLPWTSPIDPPIHFSQVLCLSYYSIFHDADRLPVISMDSRAGSWSVTSAGKSYRFRVNRSPFLWETPDPRQNFPCLQSTACRMNHWL